MLSLSSGFNYYLCSEPVTLRYRHAGLRNYIKSQLHRDPTNGDIYLPFKGQSSCSHLLFSSSRRDSYRKDSPFQPFRRASLR